jgi:hypothetical protein
MNKLDLIRAIIPPLGVIVDAPQAGATLCRLLKKPQMQRRVMFNELNHWPSYIDDI